MTPRSSVRFRLGPSSTVFDRPRSVSMHAQTQTRNPATLKTSRKSIVFFFEIDAVVADSLDKTTQKSRVSKRKPSEIENGTKRRNGARFENHKRLPTTTTTTTATTMSIAEVSERNASVFPESRDKRSVFYVGEQIDLVLRFLRTRVRGYSGMLPELSRNAMFELFARPVVDTNRRFEYFLCAITKYCDPVVEHARLLENCDLHPSVERRIANGSTVFITILASEDLPLHAAQCNLVCADVHREIVLSV